MKTLMKTLLAVLLFLPAFLAGPAGGEILAVAGAQAAEATVRVDVIKATKAGSGADKRSARFKSVLDQASMYKGFTYQEGGSLTVPLGKSQSKNLGGRTVTVTLQSLDGSKSKTAVSITGAGGDAHKTTLSLKNGATTVWAIKQGDSADLVIVKVSY